VETIDSQTDINANSRGINLNNLVAIADRFKAQSTVIDVREFGSGNINDTFLVTLDSQTQKHFILQRINTHVFQQPELIMQNMRAIAEHMQQRLQGEPIAADRRWDIPRVLLTQDGSDHYIDTDGSFWRASAFIESSESFDTVRDRDCAREIGYALGTFHNLLSDLPTQRLADTLEGFHITPLYLRHYDLIQSETWVNSSPEVNYCSEFISQRRAWAYVLEDAKKNSKLPLRPIHGDPKINNILLDTTTGKAVSIIDLDTVKPGLIHYDIGDCLRSGCNPLGEEIENWDKVRFEPDLAYSILQGYLSQVKDFFTENDYEYIYDAIRSIAFELGLRFFTDYLAGNVYFRAKSKEHNLIRALVQFQLTKNIEFHSKTIRQIVRDLK
jgi:Ser/Thr protein kinase RdoA (MazF antagonist)